MKVSKLLLFLFLVFICFTQCKKGDKGDMGPVGKDGLNGKDGRNGKDGLNGNSDIKIYFYTVPDSLWEFNFYPPYSTYEDTLFVPAITKNIVDSGLVIVYVSLNPNTS